MNCPSCGAANEPGAEVCFSCRSVLSAVSKGTVLASRYEIRGLVGRGGMGTVYRARDRVLDEDVAIKILRPDLAQAQDMAERFLSEIRLARRVSHPNVCRIHEYGEDGALRFISMELVDGRSLKETVADGPLPPAQAFDVAEQAARGLAAIHEVGIVHRDLKPANLTLDHAGRVRVMDFGIAKAAGVAGDTTAGYLLGSPEYMSPEQARGRPADARSDLYALGVVVFELFVGRPPFRAETPVGTLLLHLEAPPPIDEDAERIPFRLRPILARALAKDPAARFASALELGEALRMAASSLAAGDPDTTDSEAAARRRRSRRRRTPAGVVAAIIVAGLGLFVWRERREVASPTPAPTVARPVHQEPSPPTSPKPGVADVAQRASVPESRPAPIAGPRPVKVGPSRSSLSPPARPEDPAVLRNEPAPTPPEVDPAPPSSSVGTRPAPETTAGAEAASAPGFLLVLVTPWADVAIDGEPAGQTPLRRIPLAPGAHNVRLSHPDFQPYPRKVEIRPGETTRLAIDLRQDGVRSRR